MNRHFSAKSANSVNRYIWSRSDRVMTSLGWKM